MCFVDQERAFDRVPRKLLEWALRKEEIPEVLFRSAMSLYERAKARVRVDSELSEEFEVKVGMHQESVLSTFLFAVEVDVTEFAREGALSQLLNSDDIVLMTETINGLMNNILKWKETFERKDLNVNLGKPR